jgi:AcrR family transcriptional regulator
MGVATRLGDPTSRMDRRRAETRSRLLAAAYHLISEIGLESIVIQTLTDRADVAFGSFYNYFKSKDEIVAAVIDAAIEHTADALDQVHSDSKGIDESLSQILKIFLQRCADDHTWAAFVSRTLRSGRYFEWGFGRRLRRDVLAGVQTGAFKVHDVEIAILAVSGLMMAAILNIVDKQPTGKDYASRISAQALYILGVSGDRISSLVLQDLSGTKLPPFMHLK